MVDIVQESVNRIRLNNDELRYLKEILNKVDTTNLSTKGRDFLFVLKKRVNGRLNIIKVKTDTKIQEKE
jgi:hypothetical protein